MPSDLPNSQTDPDTPRLSILPLARIRPQHEDLQRIDDADPALLELAASLQRHGLLNPITVRPDGPDWALIAGSRRLRAAELAGWTTIPAIIRTTADADSNALTVAENLIRRDLSPFEEAQAVCALLDQHDNRADLVAAAISKTTNWVEDRAAIMAYPTPLLEALHARQLTLAAVRALARVSDPDHRHYLTAIAIDQGANARVISSWVNDWLSRQTGHLPPNSAPKPTLDAQPAPEITVTCFACARPEIFSMSQIFRFCRDCAAAIAASSAPEPSPPPPPYVRLAGNSDTDAAPQMSNQTPLAP